MDSCIIPDDQIDRWSRPSYLVGQEGKSGMDEFVTYYLDSSVPVAINQDLRTILIDRPHVKSIAEMNNPQTAAGRGGRDDGTSPFYRDRKKVRSLSIGEPERLGPLWELFTDAMEQDQAVVKAAHAVNFPTFRDGYPINTTERLFKELLKDRSKDYRGPLQGDEEMKGT